MTKAGEDADASSLHRQYLGAGPHQTSRKQLWPGHIGVILSLGQLSDPHGDVHTIVNTHSGRIDPSDGGDNFTASRLASARSAARRSGARAMDARHPQLDF